MFPLVALFHVVMLLYGIWQYSTEPFPSAIWMQVLWMLLFTIAWVFICDMKRWAALLYIGLTITNILLRFFLTSSVDISNYTDAFFPADILFSFFILFFYRRFE